jgi:hypothetical protein
MPTHAEFSPAVRLVLLLWLPLLGHTAQAQTQVQTQGSRSLADEMDISNTATGRMLELVKAAKAQEQAAKGFGPALPLTAVNPVTPPAPGKGNTNKKPPDPKEPPETPTLWYLAGVGERLVAELIYQQRVYKLTASGVAQSAGPWKLLSMSHQGLSLSHPNGQVLELHAPEPGQAPPQLAAAIPAPATPAPPASPAVPSTVPMAVPAIMPALAPGTSPFPNMFPLPK